MATREREAEGAETRQPGYDFTYTQNRELSWLQFDNRVLDEARDPQVPLLERLKMAAIFESNLDEFVMIRMGSLGELASLKRQPIDNKSNQTPSQQLADIYSSLPALIARHDETVAALEEELEARGISRAAWDGYTDEQRSRAETFFDDTVLPVTSPQIVDPRHPFPNLRNDALYCVFNLASASEAGLLGIIEVPPNLPRLVALPKTGPGFSYTLIEDVILACGTGLFGEYHTSERAVIRLTRNADIDPDEGAFDVEDDYREHIKQILKKRLRLNPVRLEVQGPFAKPLVKRIRKAFGLSEKQVFRVSAPLRMGEYVYSIEGKLPQALAMQLTYPPFTPQPPASVDPDVPMHEQIEDRDILLYYPYESMEPFLRLLHESSQDPDVMQIKITLYRVAKKSRLCESLIAAAENGIDVTVVMELRARFDEENNIEWAERLEDAGCTVLYGSAGFKVHSKICQITRRVNGEVTRITQLGTGNYNEKTAALYCDYSFMTADPRIGEDASRFFRNMQIGNLQGDYKYLGVAPVGLKPLIMRGINREIAKARAGEPAYLCFKMNSLTDREVIDRLSEASCAGVKVELIVRGISCLLPGVPGKTENISIRCIVGRMLEHARVYMFGVDRGTMYLSSADMMTRNTEHRVEIAYPILDPALRQRIAEDVKVQLDDNVKARILQPDGTYARVPVEPGEPLVNAQEFFMRRAVRAAEELSDRLASKESRSRRRPVPSGAAPSAPEPTAAVEGPALAQAPEPEPEQAQTGRSTAPKASREQPEPSPAPAAAPTPATAVPGPEPGLEERPTKPADEQPAPIFEPAPEAVVEAQDEGAPAAEMPAVVRADVQVDVNPESPSPAPEPVEVEATTVPGDAEGKDGPTQGPADFNSSLEIMVRQKGRAATGWALIKMGFKILFRGGGR